ncbi:unnamed protein product [Nyctereutes procyonoides]|uniref:(raccoon dog) hypothetical protein n=1 Tax=Nyctereutes procyonoides TaxID=34880 RepID=A0A811YJE1_NYCPR|nr:unnamed protein product [Nyctereutes procyonoides]
MAQSLCPPLPEPWLLSACWGPARHPDGGCSPASSPDSWGSVPAGSPEPSPVRPGGPAAPRARSAGRRGARGSRLGSGQRQSASEREKLRMRTLARALHELRRFLPPSVAPAGQSLTKIETLRLAIRYIGHLSAVLGLSEESLQRRRRRRGDAAAPPCCQLCPDGGGGGGGGGPARRRRRRRRCRCRCRRAPRGAWAPRCPGGPRRPLFPGDVLALLETWMPLSPLEWPPA